MRGINNLDVLIVEDSLSYSLELERLCEELGFNVVDTVEDSGTAFDTIFSESPDLILMDIDIKGKLNGIEIGQKIKHLDIPILYITSYSDQLSMRMASSTNIAGYLVKPVMKNKISQVLKEIVVKNFGVEKDGDAKLVSKPDNVKSLFVQENGQYKKIELDHVVYINSEDNYCRLKLQDGSNYLMRITLSEIERMTENLGFFRCHRGYVINKSMITSITLKDNKVMLGGEYSIPFSRNKRDELKNLIF